MDHIVGILLVWIFASLILGLGLGYIIGFMNDSEK